MDGEMVDIERGLVSCRSESWPEETEASAVVQRLIPPAGWKA